MLRLCLLTLLAVVAVVSSAEIRPSRFSRQASRIINGVDAYPGEVRHQLSLEGVVLGFRCGASVIADTWALTAAHCVDGILNGSPSLNKVTGQDINNSEFELGVLQIIQHPDYNSGPGSFPNDIALLRLPENNILSSLKVRVAAPDDGLFTGDICVISGYGNTENGAPTNLQLAEVSVLSNGECSLYWEMFDPDNPAASEAIQDQHICVKGYATPEGTGACNGDSGGPLTCFDPNGNSVLAGATSWGATGCHNNGTVEYPSVYARTSYFHEWINGACGGCLQ